MRESLASLGVLRLWEGAWQWGGGSWGPTEPLRQGSAKKCNNLLGEASNMVSCSTARKGTLSPPDHPSLPGAVPLSRDKFRPGSDPPDP